MHTSKEPENTHTDAHSIINATGKKEVVVVVLAGYSVQPRSWAVTIESIQSEDLSSCAG